MTAVKFQTGSESATSKTVTFTPNPSFPQQGSEPVAALITAEAADGTPLICRKGRQTRVTLEWPAEAPMTADDYADFQEFYDAIRAEQDRFTYTDAAGDTHAAHIMGWDVAASHVAHGFAVQIDLLVLT